MRIETVVIEIINTCNLQCQHCYGLFEKQVTMSCSDFENYLKQLYDLGATRLTISGGEPFLVGEKLLEYIHIARKIGFPYIAITTNGTICNNNVMAILENINLLQVSIDGNESTHDEIRGIGTFSKAIKFVRNIAKVCHEKVSIMMALHNKNYLQLYYVHRIAQQLNISFAVEIVTPCGRGEQIIVLDKNQMHTVNKYLKANGISCNDPISFCNKNTSNLFNQQLLAGCAAGVSALCVDSYGIVFPCTRLRIPMGNLKNGIATIFKSKIFKELNDRTLIKGRCSKCMHLFKCGGCRARAFASFKDYLAEDPCCITFNDNRNENRS